MVLLRDIEHVLNATITSKSFKQKFTFSFFWEDCEWLHNLRSYPKYFFTSRFHENLELYLQWANKAKGMGAEISAQKLRVFDKMRVFTTEDTGSGYETLCAWIPLSHSIMSWNGFLTEHKIVDEWKKFHNPI